MVLELAHQAPNLVLWHLGVRFERIAVGDDGLLDRRIEYKVGLELDGRVPPGLGRREHLRAEVPDEGLLRLDAVDERDVVLPVIGAVEYVRLQIDEHLEGMIPLEERQALGEFDAGAGERASAARQREREAEEEPRHLKSAGENLSRRNTVTRRSFGSSPGGVRSPLQGRQQCCAQQSSQHLALSTTIAANHVMTCT